MKVTVCIGSSCHIKGSHAIVEELTRLVNENGLSDKVELCGAFCMGNCMKGVSVKLDDKLYSLRPEDTYSFFQNEVLTRC